jgi:hypothetical protein
MSLTSKDDLWQVTADLPWQDVPIRKPPNGQVVATMRVRGLSGEEVNEWQDASSRQVGKVRRQSKHAMAQLIVMAAINEDGSQFFEPRETLKVSQMPGYALMQLTEVALKLSGLTDDDAKELIENFGNGLSELSTSDSH